MHQSFADITSFLLRHQNYWRHDPFHQVISEQVLWRESAPQLFEWLQTLSPQEILELKSSTECAIEALEPYISDVRTAHIAIELSSMHSAEELVLPRGLDAGIPGRKLEQIKQMTTACLNDHAGNEWLEWCSGKGFLGRLLASESKQSVTSFEFQLALCKAGQEEADKRALPMRFVQGDAFSPQSKLVFKPTQHAVALHACGDLHVTLIKHTVEQHLSALTISPCCYHLIQGENYSPLSKEGKAAKLSLSKHELRIPLQETVTGGERVRRHREQEMVFRLGFDALCQSHKLSEGYLPIPSIKKSQLSSGFKALCKWAANNKQLDLPDVDFGHFEQMGHQRYRQMEALSVVQGVFRRPLEVWLALDKALYLQEQGYNVGLSTFCEPSVTPRNILIHAKRAY
ncbi:hypothetical protein VME0621_02790 [Vibrio mediterranei]|uniref:methyltransferase n=1 Tax=Vibrio mediterranei TaxID=689 RepID=UPI0007815BE0|nr:methyltransferase [Vibrio mediterranei]SBO10668.1 hypothetical protein VME0621_02790 [Vibrio mediterranei]